MPSIEPGIPKCGYKAGLRCPYDGFGDTPSGLCATCDPSQLGTRLEKVDCASAAASQPPRVLPAVKKSGISVEMNPRLTSYDARGWNWFSMTLGWDVAKGKKTLGNDFKWQNPAHRTRNPSATGFGIAMGEENGCVCIDVDDPSLEHNKRLMELCGAASNCVARTKKGFHYLFAYTPKLAKTLLGGKLGFDVKTNGGFILVEPSYYKTPTETIKYKWERFPDDDEALRECPDDIIAFIYDLKAPKPPADKAKVKELAKKDKERVKTERAMDAMNISLDKEVAKVREVLAALDAKRADDYGDWLRCAYALKNSGLPYELFDEFSNRSTKSNDGSPFYLWQGLKKDEAVDAVSLRTIYWWLKNDNPDKFIEMCARTNEYLKMKLDFEMNNCLIGSTLYSIHDDGVSERMKVADARIKFLNREVVVWNEEAEKNEKVPFLEKWLRDPTRKDYDRVDFVPKPLTASARVYNLYDGLRAERLAAECADEGRAAKRAELVAPILNHITLLTGGEDNGWFIAWLANIVQSPANKSDCAVLIRDEGKFLTEGGGTGKNIFFEWFGYKVLGDKYYLGIADNATLYDSFNSAFEGILLVFIDEASGNDNHRQSDKLKAKITSKKTLVNRKNVAQYVVNDYARYAFASNNHNPLRVGTGDRRMTAYDASTEKRDNAAYFNALAEHMAKDEVVIAFYEYLMDYTTYKTPVEFQKARPITKAYVSMRRANAPLITRWLVDDLRGGRLRSKQVSHLYDQFIKWCEKTKERTGEDKTLTLTKFGLLLNDNINLMRPEDPETDDELCDLGEKKDLRNGSKFFNWNYKALVEHLEKLYLLEKGEVKLNDDGTPVCMIE